MPHDVPWFPKDVEHWSVRWVAMHLIEELARHAGHADIIRESIDGATMYELMAGLEGWPETDWIKPWRPAAVSVAGKQVVCRPEAERQAAARSSCSTRTSATPAIRRCC